jgi:glucose 1-dehydrogenase
MPSTAPFAGKIALVTGASGGIGSACVRALASAGADIAAADVRFTELGESALTHARQLGRSIYSRPFDIADQSACEAFVNKAVESLGGIDLHVASAVYSDREPFTTADMTGFRKTIDISMWGSYYMLRAVANAMIRQKRGGAIVIVSSPHAQVPFPNCMAYNMAKAGQDAMARTAAIELLPHKIRVNILHPGWTDTPGERKYFSEADLARVGPTLPSGRLATADEMARGTLFLLDPANEHVNGTTLTMDGGLSLPWWSKRGTGGL